jgi:hypothetical protein
MKFLTRHAWIAALLLMETLSGCVHDPTPTSTSPLDGLWASPPLGYDLALAGMIGLAEGAKAKGLQDGDPVLRLTALEGSRILARQWMSDGQWHSVTMERSADGTLRCTDGSRTWTLTRKAPHPP